MTGTPRHLIDRSSENPTGLWQHAHHELSSRALFPEALGCSVWASLSRRQGAAVSAWCPSVREGQSGHEHRWAGPQIQPTMNVEATHGVTRCTGTRHGCERQRGDRARPARREVELGLPGLLRRPYRRSHTGGTGPTPRLDLSPRCLDLTQGSRSPTLRLVPPGCAEVGWIIARWWLRLIRQYVGRGLAQVRGTSWGVWRAAAGRVCGLWSFLCLPPRPVSPSCGEPREPACRGWPAKPPTTSSWRSTRPPPTPSCTGHAAGSRSTWWSTSTTT